MANLEINVLGIPTLKQQNQSNLKMLHLPFRNRSSSAAAGRGLRAVHGRDGRLAHHPERRRVPGRRDHAEDQSGGDAHFR